MIDGALRCLDRLTQKRFFEIIFACIALIERLLSSICRISLEDKSKKCVECRHLSYVRIESVFEVLR